MGISTSATADLDFAAASVDLAVMVRVFAPLSFGPSLFFMARKQPAQD